MITKIEETARYLVGKGFEGSSAGLVLGTGLGAFVERVKIIDTISYHDIPHFPVATVEFHKGRLILGELAGKKIMVMQGRFHYYEGYSMQEITFPVRVMKALGVRNLLLSNAAGGMNPGYRKGDLVLIEDHINQLPENPLRGLNDPAYGERFVDMSQPYSEELNGLLLNAAHSLNIPLKKGVYVSVMGPNLETRAEYRFLRNIGADMVGMSTVPEVIVANQVGIACAAISVITDECDPDNLKPVNITEIIAVAGKADESLSQIFLETLQAC
ncbi:MAG: purine-nucleoside phosphorylase [Chitinophagaceae bacterium]